MLIHWKFLIFCAWLSMGFAQVIWASPEMGFRPNPMSFAALPVGQSQSQILVIKNVGDTTLVVSGGTLAKGTGSVFRVTVPAFQLAPGDSTQLSVRFEPTTGGTHADVLSFNSNAQSKDPTLPRPVLQLVGVATGPEVSVTPLALGFASTGVGVGVSQTVTVSNTGSDSLQVTQLKTGTARFVANATAFVVAPNSSRNVTVTYTPDSSSARVDTLTLVTNDFDEGVVNVVLDAQETPVRLGTARLAISRGDTLKFPGVGDTVSVVFTLKPNGASVAGVDAFFSYDSTLFRPANATKPFVQTGYTLTRLTSILKNAVVGFSGRFRVAYLSALGGTRDSIRTDGVFAKINLVVRTPLKESTRLRVMVESPLYNSQMTTPAGLSFTLPSEGSLTLGNTPPVIRPFPPVVMQEDVPQDVALASLATDAESSFNDLKWTFRDPQNLFTVTVSIPDSTKGPVARFFPPFDGSGTFAVIAYVSDPAGASDSSVVVLDVVPTNDPPLVPKVVAPTDSAANVAMPVILRWRGGDPDRGDVVRYDILFGPNPLFLTALASDVRDTAYANPSFLLANTVYFWRVVAKDVAGLQTQGPIWQFRTQLDTTPPVFITEPNVLAVSDTTADVFWNTDEPASARLVLGLSETLSDSSNFTPVVPSGRIQIRNISITGLLPGTTYFFQVTMDDVAGNVTKSGILSFKTSGQSTVIIPPADVGDLDGDRKVNFADFIIFAAAFGHTATETQYVLKADINADGRVDFSDFLLFAGVFGVDYAAGIG